MNIASIANPAAPVVQANLLTDAQRARAAHLKGSALRSASPTEQRAAVASQFEAVLVRQLLGKTMTKMLNAGAGESTAGGIYGDMITDTLANQLTAGRGLGLGRMIEQQLTPRGLPAAAAGALVAAQTQAHP
jgi:Rod binding domain-containing protein